MTGDAGGCRLDLTSSLEWRRCCAVSSRRGDPSTFTVRETQVTYKAPDYKRLIAGWWKPEAGETADGIFMGSDESPSMLSGGMQTFFGLRKDDGSEVKVSCNFNLAKAFDEAGVRIGDRVKVKYLGRKGRAHNYEVERVKKAPAGK